MDLWIAAKVIGRRWLLLMGGLILVAGVVAGMAIKIPTTYSAKTTLLLLPPVLGGAYQPTVAATPAAKGKPTPTPEVPPRQINPYLAFDSSLYVLARIVQHDLLTDEKKAELQARGATAKYDVAPESDFPAITVVATNSDTAVIAATIREVNAAAVADVADRQKATGVPPGTWVTVDAGSTPLSATRTNAKNKTLLIVAGLGFIAAISLVFITESIAGRRSPIESKPNVPRLLAKP